jgi:hypothetical protein
LCRRRRHPRYRLAVVLSQHGHFQQGAALRLHLHPTRCFSGFNQNRNRFRDPVGKGVGAKKGLDGIGTRGHVVESERAVSAGSHRLNRAAHEKPRLIRLKRQPRCRQRLVGVSADNFAFNAGARFQDQLDIRLSGPITCCLHVRKPLLRRLQHLSG